MFKHKLYAMVGALLMVALTLGGTTALAQDGPQMFTSDDGTLVFEYPAGWLAEEYFGTILLANSEATFEAMMDEADQIAPGQALIVVMTPQSLMEDGAAYGLSADMSLEEMASAYATNVIQLENVDAPQSGTLGAHAIARLDAQADQGEVTLYSVGLDDGHIGLAVLLTASGERDEYIQAVENVVSTMAYQAPPEATETATLVWQQVFPIDFEDEDSYYWVDDIAIGSDDTIYVLDSNVGIRVFNADGEPQNIIVPDDPFWGLAAFDLADDGTFWGIDSWGTVGHFDAEGAVLSSFDATATEIGEVAFVGLRLLVGPDGNLYIVNPHDIDDETAMGMLYVVTPEGEVLQSIELGTEDYSFEAYLAFGPDGNLYMIPVYDNRGINVYDPSGNLLTEGLGEDALSFTFSIGGLAVGADGSIYVADFKTIYHLSETGELLGKFGQNYYNTPESDDELPFPEGTFADISALGVLSNGDVIVGDSSISWWQLVRISFSQ